MGESVIFTGSTPENITNAKEFWKCFDAQQDEIRSTLHVPGIDHRLPTADRVNASNTVPNYFHQTCGGLQESHPGFIRNMVQGERRRKNEEVEYVNHVLDMKDEQRCRLSNQRQQRLKKEKIRETFAAVEEIFPCEEDSLDVEEAIQTMNDIDNFDRMKKIEKENEKEHA